MNQGSGAILVSKNRKLIGLQLKDDLDFLYDKWKIATFGGGRENDETPEETLKRELEEELELDLGKYIYKN